MTTRRTVRVVPSVTSVTSVHPALPSLLERSETDPDLLADKRYVAGYLDGWEDREQAEDTE